MKELADILDTLKGAIEDVTLGNFTKASITDDLNLMNDIGLDSLDYASVMLAGETHTGKKINENNVVWRDIMTVKQLATLLYEAQK